MDDTIYDAGRKKLMEDPHYFDLRPPPNHSPIFDMWDCSWTYKHLVARGTYGNHGHEGGQLILNRWLAQLRMIRQATRESS